MKDYAEIFERKEKLLNPKFLKLLKKSKQKPLTSKENAELFGFAIKHCLDNEIPGDLKGFSPIHSRFLDNPSTPIAQVGFQVSPQKGFAYLISVNKIQMDSFCPERIIMVACHEFAHLVNYQRFIQQAGLNMANEDAIGILVGKMKSNKAKNWYESKLEYEADKFGYAVAKNIYQRAVHDTKDRETKYKYWDSYELLDMNEKIEIDKHQRAMNGDGGKESK